MVNLICGIVAVVIVSLFVGGLAESIWQGTGSIAFPVIVAIVLIMIYIDFWESVRKNK